MRYSYIIAIVVFLAGAQLPAQFYVPGQTYFGADNYIEYQPGNIPLIISVPHGGRLEPANLPDRDCDGCSYLMDSYTQELAREIRSAFVKQTGCYPHVVYNLLHRKKLDMNRNLVTATDSNSALDTYWTDYHEFIDSAKTSILRQSNKGLFIDLHGHGHTKQRIEYGYLLYESQLRESDSMINTPERVNVSSIRNLVGTNRGLRSHADLLRGDQALGTLFAARGFPGVPSMQDPAPLEEDLYFNGGYNTLEHGSNPGGTIDAIQMELYSAIRFNTAQRASFAENFATVLRSYLQTHYFDGFLAQRCGLTSTDEDHAHRLSVLPNPASEIINLSGQHSQVHTTTITDMLGAIVHHQSASAQTWTIDVRPIPSGVYSLQLLDAAGRVLSATTIVICK